mmetsp:Transcript_14306/g.40662  ORF Transcript_14306/g.40662 Transcript_14306/m.40662 type:complete len:157 (-) Transcript_14306:1188-1658(-)
MMTHRAVTKTARTGGALPWTRDAKRTGGANGVVVSASAGRRWNHLVSKPGGRKDERGTLVCLNAGVTEFATDNGSCYGSFCYNFEFERNEEALPSHWKPTIRVAVSGAAGQISNHLLFQVCCSRSIFFFFLHHQKIKKKLSVEESCWTSLRGKGLF